MRLAALVFSMVLPQHALAQTSVFDIAKLGDPVKKESWAAGETRSHLPDGSSTYWGSSDGWQLWQLDTGGDRLCRAIKSDQDTYLIRPVYDWKFEEFAPSISIHSSSGRQQTYSTSEGDGVPGGQNQWRLEGEETFRQTHFGNDRWADHDGQILEVKLPEKKGAGDKVSSFPKVYKIDLTGAASADVWVRACLLNTPDGANK